MVQKRGFGPTDEKSWKVWEKTFANELTIDFGGVKPPQRTTPKDLMDWAKKTYATVKTQHMLFNMDIHLDGNQATSKSYGHARHERTDNGDFWHIYAIYEHDHVRTPNGWRISKIKMRTAKSVFHFNMRGSVAKFTHATTTQTCRLCASSAMSGLFRIPLKA